MKLAVSMGLAAIAVAQAAAFRPSKSTEMVKEHHYTQHFPMVTPAPDTDDREDEHEGRPSFVPAGWANKDNGHGAAVGHNMEHHAAHEHGKWEGDFEKREADAEDDDEFDFEDFEDYDDADDVEDEDDTGLEKRDASPRKNYNMIIGQLGVKIQKTNIALAHALARARVGDIAPVGMYKARLVTLKKKIAAAEHAAALRRNRNAAAAAKKKAAAAKKAAAKKKASKKRYNETKTHYTHIMGEGRGVLTWI